MAQGIGLRLLNARKLRGLSQAKLAKDSGVTQASISDLETGKSRAFKGTTLIAIAQTLQVNPQWLESGQGPMEEIGSPLPPEAVRLARDWLRLAPEVRNSVADMVRQMVKASSADKEAVPDRRVEDAYGSPGQKAKARHK